MDKNIRYIRTVEDINKNSKIVLFGAGQTSCSAIKLLKGKNIICIFDNDPNKWGNEIEGYKVYPPTEIQNIVDGQTAIVISTVSYQYEIARDLLNKYNISEENIFSYTNEYCEKNIYNPEKIRQNTDNIIKAIEILEDEESKKYVERSIALRLSRNPLYAENNILMQNSYEYSNIVLAKEGDSIVDCGAYIGDTAELFVNKLNGKCKIYCIEPFKESYEKLIKNRVLKDKAEFFNYAISNRKSTYFIGCSEKENAVTANIESFDGEIYDQIQINTLDSILENVKKIDFIKMDIEGQEINALNGAIDIIKKFKPRMMISAYHLVEHIWQIPILIKEIEPNYKIYAGHQYNAPFEIEYYITI